MITKRLGTFLRLMGLSRVSMLGAGLVTSSVIADIILIVGETVAFESHPYMGIFTYMFFPGMATFGLLLIPLGIYWKIRSLGKGETADGALRLARAAGKDRMASVVQVLVVLTLFNLVLFGVVGYRGFHYTESREFCGQLCHTVMEPEFTTYSLSPHSEVRCVECHIGPGAGWFVKSKLSGARQVLAVAFDTYPRPIQTPIENLRPAREVCEVCHRPDIFTGDRIKVIEKFQTDEANTPLYTVLNLRVGEGGPNGHGIHWHVSEHNQIRYYATDRKRENVVWIELTRPDGSRKVWTRSDAPVSEDQIPHEKLRTMDCVDCHNRPTHIYLSPEQAIDTRLSSGDIDASIPWIRKISEEVLVPEYETTESAMAGIAKVPEIYRERYPDAWTAHRDGIEAAVPVLQKAFNSYVFPDMKVGWNTYVSLIGHPDQQSARCFRCHNGVLRDPAGTEISLDCNTCHYVLATAQPDPQILKVLSGE